MLTKQPPRVPQPWRKPLGTAVATLLRGDMPSQDQFLTYLRHWSLLPHAVMLKTEATPLVTAFRNTQDRFETGTWKKPVWAKEDWCRYHPMTPLHQAHISTRDSGLIAYTQSIDKMARDIQTPIKPGRYLAKYYSDVLSDEQIRYWATRHASPIDSTYEMHILRNDDWVWGEAALRKIWVSIYDTCHVDYSCMGGSAAPSVYGMPGNHLGLVTWTRQGAGDPFRDLSIPTYGRAIIRTDRATPEYIRVYPFAKTYPGGAEHALQAVLQAAGYHYGHDLSGIHLIYEQTNADKLVCPYIDGDAQCVKISQYNGRQSLCITYRGIKADIDTGIVFTSTCHECGAMVRPEELMWIDGEDIDVCRQCLEREFVAAHDQYQNVVYMRPDAAYYCQSDREYYTEAGLEYHSIVRVDAGRQQGKYYSIDDVVPTSRGYVLPSEAVKLSEPDPEGNDWAYKDDVVNTEDGRTIAKVSGAGTAFAELPGYASGDKKMKLYHATTQKKAKLYRQSGAIHAPVRGFTTMQAAMAWAMKVGRVVILEFEADKPHKLPDHHNVFGEAWWNDGDVKNWRCVFSAIGDA